MVLPTQTFLFFMVVKPRPAPCSGWFRSPGPQKCPLPRLISELVAAQAARAPAGTPAVAPRIGAWDQGLVQSTKKQLAGSSFWGAPGFCFLLILSFMFFFFGKGGELSVFLFFLVVFPSLGRGGGWHGGDRRTLLGRTANLRQHPLVHLSKQRFRGFEVHFHAGAPSSRMAHRSRSAASPGSVQCLWHLCDCLVHARVDTTALSIGCKGHGTSPGEIRLCPNRLLAILRDLGGQETQRRNTCVRACGRCCCLQLRI